jgi:hydroxymethylglutaryl-CoA synthase
MRSIRVIYKELPVMAAGILSFGAYLPQSRLQRKSIADAHSWFDPSLRGLGQGERSMGSWDEDSNTMAVEAGRACLAGLDRSAVNALYLGSSSLPFLDRQNGALVGEALELGSELQTFDLAGSQKAGTSALLAALKGAAAGERGLVIGSDKRRTKAGSTAEMNYGDGAASLLVGEGDAGKELAAELVASRSLSVDFVDHFRTQESEFDYQWEARWIRDEGLMKLIPEAVNALFKDSGIGGADIAHFCCPVGNSREQQSLAKKLGVKAEAMSDTLQSNCGNTGAAHALLMLVGALEAAAPGDLIMVLGFGQGCDALLFRATGAAASVPVGNGLEAALSNRREEENYFKFLAFNGLIAMEHGLRAETDKNTGLSTAYRNRQLTTAFTGGKCRECGTVQIPSAPICVNAECGAVDSQDPHPFADATAFLKSYTSDRLTYSMNPPAYYGMIQFVDGGRIMLDFADVLPDKGLEVGMPMRMAFRVKDYDHKRGFRRYYWKAVPVYSAEGE